MIMPVIINLCLLFMQPSVLFFSHVHLFIISVVSFIPNFLDFYSNLVMKKLVTVNVF